MSSSEGVRNIPTGEGSRSIATEVVDDFLIVSQNDPNRPSTYVSGNLYTTLATTRETDFSFNLIDFFATVGSQPPLHYHLWENELWYVTDGELQFTAESAENSLTLSEGGLFFSPRAEVHTWGNEDSEADIVGVTPGARAISFVSPGALDLLFEAVGVQATDLNAPIPSTEEAPLDLETFIKFGARIDAPVVFTGLGASPDYTAPEDSLDYVVVFSEDAEQEVVEEALALAENVPLDVWTLGNHDGIPQRPTITGSFGIEYTSLLTLEETGNEFSYNQFSLESQNDTANFPESVTSEDHVFFYVTSGELSIRIGEEERTVGEDTFVYIAPENQYSIANLGNETVESLEVTVIDRQSPFPSPNEQFPSPLSNRDGLANIPLTFHYLSNKDDWFNGISAQDTEGTRRIYGDDGNDQILVNSQDRAFGEDGDDILIASWGNGHNLLDGGKGNDILIAGSSDQLVGGEGEDLLYIRSGDGNHLYGGTGADEFNIVNGSLPDAVEVEYPEYLDDVIVEGVTIPDLVDTRNTIMDFELGVDKIRITGVENIVSSFEDLELLPAFGDLGSTSIIATYTEDGIEKEISLANVSGVIFNELSPDDFVFT
ncbi:MAG: cupin domain-containing protein [Xenococcaceae cyanobacterium MO_207.B15]|nr:cupin domain-containing protein [Xenococcaceae cyanobacterium MO_207.B15]